MVSLVSRYLTFLDSHKTVKQCMLNINGWYCLKALLPSYMYMYLMDNYYAMYHLRINVFFYTNIALYSANVFFILKLPVANQFYCLYVTTTHSRIAESLERYILKQKHGFHVIYISSSNNQ